MKSDIFNTSLLKLCIASTFTFTIVGSAAFSAGFSAEEIRRSTPPPTRYLQESINQGRSVESSKLVPKTPPLEAASAFNYFNLVKPSDSRFPETEF